MSGFCANPDEGTCVDLGVSGCASSSDCCSDDETDMSATCKQGRCCYKDGGSCQSDTECCDSYYCDDATSTCQREDDE
ncbi:unnamed protein product [Laminaria digitata]